MANNKMTKRDYFAQILANYALTEDEQKFINHEIELLEKKNSGEKKPTEKQIANDVMKNAIFESMVSGEKYTITDMIKTFPVCNGLSTSKVSTLLYQMIDNGKVVRTEEKRRAYFSKVED